jgi:hypothetical protein
LVNRTRQIPRTVQSNQTSGYRSGGPVEFIDIAAQFLELSQGVTVTPQLIEGLSRCEDFIETRGIQPSLPDNGDLFVRDCLAFFEGAAADFKFDLLNLFGNASPYLLRKVRGSGKQILIKIPCFL